MMPTNGPPPPGEGLPGRPLPPNTADVREIAAALDVPPDLRSYPGIQKNPTDEAYFAYAYPLRDLNSDYPYYSKWRWQISEAMRAVKATHGDKLAGLRDTLQNFHVRAPTVVPDGRDLTREVKQRAHALGFGMIGVAPFDRKYVFQEYVKRVQFRTIVVMARELDYDATQTYPSVEAEVAFYGKLYQAGAAAYELAQYILAQGYRVQFVHPAGFDLAMVLSQAYAIEAGLGQMGANGQLLTPLFGSRATLLSLTTDAPLTRDEPVDYGINVICEKCQVCVQRCPGRALPKVRVNWRGILKYKTITERCIPMVSRYDGCSVCLRVCPIQKFGLSAVLDHYRDTGQILGKGTEALEGYDLGDKGHFGPGELPTFTEEERWFPGSHLIPPPGDTKQTNDALAPWLGHPRGEGPADAGGAPVPMA
jgi:epoxyqueuosine reductase